MHQKRKEKKLYQIQSLQKLTSSFLDGSNDIYTSRENIITTQAVATFDLTRM